MAAYILIGGLIFGLVGYLIGDKKGRGTLGGILGFFLGVIGVIIIAVIPPAKSDDRLSIPFDPGAGPGWFNDPHHRYELRYWDGVMWTEHVSNDGLQAVDGWMPPPPPPTA